MNKGGKNMKLKAMLVLTGVLILSLNVLGAGKNIRDVMTENQELRKNLTWTTEGIYLLSKNKDRHLAITSEQAGRLLPVFQGLIDQGWIRMEMPKKGRINPGGRQGAGNPGFGNQPPEGSGPPNGPGMDPQKQAQLMERIEFGKREMRRIDSMLTKNQVQFIDNMDFHPEKYGFLAMNNSPGASSQGGGQSSGQFRMAGKPNAKIRQQMEESRKRLIQLNQDVVKGLKQLAAKKR
jgi:hypothetical protein